MNALFLLLQYLYIVRHRLVQSRAGDPDRGQTLVHIAVSPRFSLKTHSERLTNFDGFDFMGYFKFLEKHGYVEFVR